jgi:hypothetical protein
MGELKRKVAFGLAAGVVGFVAAGGVLGFLSLALFFWLATAMSAAWAAALTALIILVTAAIVIMILRAVGRGRRAPQPQPQPASTPGDIAAEIGNLFGQQARGFATRHTGATILGSLALGFMVGVSPGLRDLLRRGL